MKKFLIIFIFVLSFFSCYDSIFDYEIADCIDYDGACFRDTDYGYQIQYGYCCIEKNCYYLCNDESYLTLKKMYEDVCK